MRCGYRFGGLFLSKVSGAITPPKVADKGGQDLPHMNDFSQSEERQQLLELARKQREVNLTSRNRTNDGNLDSEPEQSEGEDSTKKIQRSSSKSFLERVDEAREKREKILSQRAAEIDNSGRSESASFGRVKTKDGVDVLAHAISGAQRRIKRNTNSERQDHNSSAPASHVPKRKTAIENISGEIASPPSGTQANLESAKNDLQEKIALSRVASLFDEFPAEKNSDTLPDSSFARRRSIKSGLVAVTLGCAAIVTATSFAFFVLPKWKSTTASENASSVNPSAELVEPTARSDRNEGELETPTSGFPTKVQNLAYSSPDAIEAPPLVPEPESIFSETTDTPIKIVAAPRLPEMSVDRVPIAPGQLRVAPDVLRNLVALEQPRALTMNSDRAYQTDSIPGFVKSTDPQTAQGSVPVLLNQIAAVVQGIDIPAAATAPSNPPDQSFLPVALYFGEDYKSLQAQALTFRSKPDVSDIFPAMPNSPEPVKLAVLDFDKPPKVPNPIEKKGVRLTTISSPSETETNDLPPNSEGLAPNQLQPSSIPSEAITTSTEPVAAPEPVGSAAGKESARFVLFAPSSLTEDMVETVVTNLETTGHDLRASNSVDFEINKSNVRFYHPQDAAKAAALAKDAGALLRDFTDSGSKTPNGIIELWLAGDSAAKPAEKKVSSKAPQANPVDLLKKRVLSKLRTATDQ